MSEGRKRGRPPGTTKAAMAERRRMAESASIERQMLSEGYDGLETLEDIKSEIAATDVYLAQIFGEGSILGNAAAAGLSGNSAVPKLPGTLNLSVPRPEDYAAQMRWAIEFRDQKFIKGALLRRRKFIISGFRHQHEDHRIVELFDEIAQQTSLVKRLKSIQWEKDTVGWVVVWPDQINLSPQDVGLLQHNIRIERMLGYDKIYLRLDDKLVKEIKKNPNNFPSYFYRALDERNPNGYGRPSEIELEGAYLVSAPRAIGEAYPKSPLYPLFEPVKIIESLVETEYAISFAVKQLIMHVKVKGEQTVDGKQKMATRAQLAAVARQVLTGAKTSNLVTDSGVEIDFISPDKSIFEATKVPYEQAMARIRDNIGIPMLLVSGEAQGVSYSTATFIIKGFLQDVIDEREDLLSDFVYPWYKDIAQTLYETDKSKYGFLKGKDGKWNIPAVQFNETELKNVVELLSMLKFLYDTGAVSVESVFEAFQMDHRLEKSRKEEQNNDDGWIYRPYETSQGMAHNKEFENPAQADIEYDRTSLKLQKEQNDANVEIQKKTLEIQKKAAAQQPTIAGGKPASNQSKGPSNKGGRPSNPSAAPAPGKENRNPRTESAMIDQDLNEANNENGYIIKEEKDVTINDLLEYIDNPEALDELLRPRSEKFFEKLSGEEDISD